MKKIFIALLPLFAMIVFVNNGLAQNQNPASSDSYFIIENYYKIKWGYADEFINLCRPKIKFSG